MNLRLLLAAPLLSSGAMAQAVYVDFGANPPSSSYAALASVPGVWNALPISANGLSLPAVDIQGNSTNVLLYLDWGCDSGACATPPNGDDGALLGDWFNADCYATQHNFLFSNLVPGLYRVHVYGFGESACNAAGPQVISARTSVAFLRGTISPWPGQLDSANHFELVTTVDGTGHLGISFGAGGYSGPAGLQIEPITNDIVPYCFGVLGACPCASSNGSTTGGCATSWSPAGGSIAGAGTASLSSDSITLTATNMSAAAATLIQGTGLWNGQQTFGDGMLCVTGTITRLVTRFAPGGTLVYPDVGDPSLSVSGAVPAGGATRFCQGWFRDSLPFCMPATFNLTSAVAVAWHP